MIKSLVLRVGGVWPLLLVGACGQASPESLAAHPPAATVDNKRPEADLTTVTLSPEAQKHLALQMKKVAIESVALTRTVGAETIVPPGRTVAVSAPISGILTRGPAATIGPVRAGAVIYRLTPFQQAERDVRAEADRGLLEAEARLTQLNQRLQRLQQLLKEGSTSVRAVEEAEADRNVAAAAANAARLRVASVARLPVGADGAMSLVAPFDGFITNLHSAEGQTVAAGAAIADVAQTGALWIRASIYVGDLRAIDTAQPVTMAALGQESTGPWRPLRRVAGPPAGNASAASVDLYFEADGRDAALLPPGARVAVRLPLRSTSRALVVPQSAVIYDVNGGTWVYEQRSANQFARRRVELGGSSGTNLIVVRGLAEGITIVAVGAAELYGTEFYVNK